MARSTWVRGGLIQLQEAAYGPLRHVSTLTSVSRSPCAPPRAAAPIPPRRAPSRESLRHSCPIRGSKRPRRAR